MTDCMTSIQSLVLQCKSYYQFMVETSHNFTILIIINVFDIQVIDEADRMMDEIKQDWLIQVETAVYRSRPNPQPLTASSCWNMHTPVRLHITHTH